ncbi:hypothetical protein A6R68_23186 [Neotoma lepida]|uniref:Uncharacterized protein n=1 Tax=Neotoma lepida TaxID=56216 RepID=A0A1A6HX74_NEOLE|nr:hypothetical protein A6R68_23186 [Neotoma lepida]
MVDRMVNCNYLHSAPSSSSRNTHGRRENWEHAATKAVSIENKSKGLQHGPSRHNTVSDHTSDLEMLALLLLHHKQKFL